MEIEKKFLVKRLPEHLDSYEHSRIEQGYLCSRPVVRIRRMDEDYILTYKCKTEQHLKDPVCVSREAEFPLTREAYEHLKEKIDGCMIEKTRYRIGYQTYTIELDVFHGAYEGMLLAEVEFASETEAENFPPPDWFGDNVSGDYHYTNAYLACKKQSII